MYKCCVNLYTYNANTTDNIKKAILVLIKLDFK